MTTALSIDRIVRVSVYLQPKGAARRNFGVLCLATPDDFITPAERIRYYTNLEGVAQDAGINSPTYRAAEVFFSQSPRPSYLAVGRWVQSSSPAILTGGKPESGDDVAPWTAVTDGAFELNIGDTGITVSGLDFSAQTNMNGVAQVISAALEQDGAYCTWEGDHFTIRTVATGEDQRLSFAEPPETGTDVATMAWLVSGLAESVNPGVTGETPLECAAALADAGDWYGLAFADETSAISAADHLDVSGYIEAAGRSRVYFVTVTDPDTLKATAKDDLASRLKALSRARTFVQYSKNPYAALSAAGRAFTVNFNANRSTLTLKFKQEPGIVAEGLRETEAVALSDKNCNVFVSYDNDTAILQEGVVSSGAFFDEIHGLDWLQNAAQNECYNLLYQSKTKIPQTDAGVNQIVTALGRVFGEAVNNGLIAPGVWNSDGFGQLERGDYLPDGWYIYAQPVDDQPQSEREQRKAPPIQCAVKLAGAVHFVDVQIDVNR